MPKRYAQLIKHVNKFMIFRYFRSTIMDIARNRTKNHAHSMLPIGTWLSSSMSTFYGHRGVLNTGSTKIGGMTALMLLSANTEPIKGRSEVK